jgi:hypothetical protein
MKNFKVFISLFAVVCGCKEKNALEQDRRKLITETVNALKTYDTLTLFSLIDTSYNFGLYGRENVMSKFEYANSVLKDCKSLVSDTSVSSRPIPGNFSRYTILFCRDSMQKIIYDSFDLLLTFADFDNAEMITGFDLKIYRRDTTPLVP